ncbi:MAG: BON domain-containing protein [Armatimonadota bacterium]|nr:BON domain-containing protein [Armatimonadota bacterium]
MDVREHVMAGLIRTRLAEDRRTGGQPIDVLVANGDIYLLGQVDFDNQRQAAETIIKGLVGVRHIIDRIIVRTHKDHVQLSSV